MQCDVVPEGGEKTVIKRRKPSVITFEFFEDEKGRLRATCLEFDIRRPVESIGGKRYRFAKVFGMQRWFAPADLARLQTAKAGDRVQVKVR